MIEYVLETLSVFVLNTIETFGYFGVFILMALESANIPIPSEIIMPFSGFLVSRHVFNFWLVVLVGALGNLFGSIVSYVSAKYFKDWVMSNHNFGLVEKWFGKYGLLVAFWSRLMPIVRTFISFPAGMFKLNLWKFSLLTFAGSFIWSAILTYPGVYLGENWASIEPYFRKFDVVIAILLLVGIVWGIKMHFFKKK